MKFLVLFLLTVGISKTQAQTTSFFDIDTDNINYGSIPLAARDKVKGIFEELERQGQAELSNIEPGDYLKYSADSTIVSGKFVGSDYANNIDLFMVGLGVGVGVSLKNDSFSDVASGDTELEDANGAGLQASLMGGVNLKFLPIGASWPEFLKPERFTLLFNFLKYDAEKDDFSADALSYGIKLRWLAVQGKSFAPFELATWEGLHVHFGFQKSNLDLTASDAFTTTDSDSQGGTTYTGTFNSTAVIDAEIDTLSIPLEVSSAMRLLNVFTFFGGFGLDLNAGSGKGNANLSNATVEVTGGGNTASTTATANLGQKQDPESMFSRYFLGLQLNLWKVKLAFQYDRVLGENTHGLGAGLKFAW